MHRLLPCLLLLVGCPSEEATSPTPEPTPAPAVTLALEDAPAVDAAVQDVVDAEALTGVVVGVSRGSEVVYLRGFGFEDVAAQTRVDPSATMFRWASVSKGLAGVVTVQGLDAGTTALDADVAATVPGYSVPTEYLPGDCEAAACVEELPEVQRTITLRQLLTHTAGIQHYSNGLVYPVPPTAETGDPAVNTGIAWAIDLFKDAPLVAAPGTEYNYSTFGYNLAGVVIEQLYGARFEAIVDAGIAQPLGMSTMQPDFPWVEIPRRAVGYVMNGDTIEEDSDTDVSWKLPGGGFISTGEDLARYCAGLASDALMTAEHRDTILWATAAPADNYGLGFGVGTSDGERRVSHTGAQEKTRTAIRMLPDRGLCFTVMTNATWANPGGLARTVADAWLGE